MLICLVVVFHAGMMPAFASGETGDVVMEYPHYFEEERSIKTLEESVDMEQFREYLFKAFSQCDDTIDIRLFNISDTEANNEALKELIWREMPESFHVYALGFVKGSGKINKIVATYRCDSDEYQKKYTELMAKINHMVSDIKDNHKLTDVEKALILHDRVALTCEYDYNSTADKQTAYGALVKRTAVCEGYTEAYQLLLREVGIENYSCYSAKLNHIWNIVYIDNQPYHVDVTWDDYAWDSGQRGAPGMIDHKNFLRSSDGIYSTGHSVDDFDNRPTSTTYDQYFWQTSRAAFQLINDELYYIDNQAAALKKYGSDTVLCNVSDIWRYTDSLVWPSNYSWLASDGTDLLYSLPGAIYRYDVTTQTSTEIFAPELSKNNSIFGFEYTDGYLVCDINNAPPYAGEMENLYQIRQFYDAQPPVGSVTSTNDVASSQTVTINMSDNVGIAGYYWGTSSTYSDNTYTATSSTSVTKNITKSGTYYLTVKDKGDNLSQTRQITFYKTTLHGNGASVTPSYIVTASGNSFRLPTASRNGYTFKGWSTSASATSGMHSLTPTGNATYYAVMKFTYTGLLKVDGVWYYFRNGVVATDVTGLVKWNGEWWYVIKGRLATEVTSLVKYNGEWWYVFQGRVASEVTNLIKYNNEWFYVVKGKIASQTTTLVKWNGSWYYIYKGKLAGNTTTLIKWGGEWFYVVKGRVASEITDLIKWGGEWFYVVNGKVASKTTTLIDYNGGRYYIYKGKIAELTTTLVKHNGTWYYVRNGKVDYSYSGIVHYGGGNYTVRNGKVV